MLPAMFSLSGLATVRSILFPVFNWGQAVSLIALGSIFVLIAIFDDAILALYMGVGAYAGIVLLRCLIRFGS